LNWRGAKFRDLTFLTIKQLDITKVDLSFSELSQNAFDFMMTGGGSAFVGMAEKGSIAEITFANANLSDISKLSSNRIL